MKTYSFISGLPRSGSTLLCNVLAQNPLFHVSKSTSGCHEVLFGIRNSWDQYPEHQLGNTQPKDLLRVLQASMTSYHDTPKDYVIDKGRGWLSLLEMAGQILQKRPKVIVPVRDIKEILASFEKIWRIQAASTQHMNDRQNYIRGQSTQGRCDMLLQTEATVGLAYIRLQDAILRGYKDCLCLVEFDDLTQDPEQTMKKIYNFLELEYFPHDFKNIVQYTQENDQVHGFMDLHTIRPEILPVAHCSSEILGSDLASKYNNVEAWRNPA